MSAPHLFGHGAPDEYLTAIDTAARAVASVAYTTTAPHSCASQAELQHQIDSIDLNTPAAHLTEALAETMEIYGQHAVWFHHTKYLAHLNCPVLIPSLVAEILISSINTSMDTWDQSRTATLIEQKLIDTTAGWFGYPPSADGIFTSGGSQSNLQALTLARGKALAPHTTGPSWQHVPTADVARLRIYAAPHSHFSIAKSAAILGIHTHAIRTIDTDPMTGGMDPHALDAAITTDCAAGLLPMIIVGTAGSTNEGIIDPLDELATVAANHNVWFHVDAAVGGALAVADDTRNLLRGIHRSDSVTIDYHKTFFQPVSCSALIVADHTSLQYVANHASYLNPRSNKGPDQVTKSLQTTRRFDALKLWLTLRTIGADGIAEMYAKTRENTRIAYRAIMKHPQFEAQQAPTLNTVSFRFTTPGADHDSHNALNQQIKDRAQAEGCLAIASYTNAGTYWLKMTILNPTLTATDLDEALHVLAGYGCDYAAAADISCTVGCQPAGASR